MIAGTFVLPEISLGMIEQSAIHRPSTLRKRKHAAPAIASAFKTIR
jgi:hypothetical protein